MYGTSTISLANRNGQNGVVISTNHATATLTDLVLQTHVANSARNIRVESRTSSCTTGQHSLQFALAGSASLSAGDNYVNVNRLYIGTQPTANTTPTALLTVNGIGALNNGASATGAITSTGSLTSINF